MGASGEMEISGLTCLLRLRECIDRPGKEGKYLPYNIRGRAGFTPSVRVDGQIEESGRNLV